MLLPTRPMATSSMPPTIARVCFDVPSSGAPAADRVFRDRRAACACCDSDVAKVRRGLVAKHRGLRINLRAHEAVVRCVAVAIPTRLFSRGRSPRKFPCRGRVQHGLARVVSRRGAAKRHLLASGGPARGLARFANCENHSTARFDFRLKNAEIEL